MIDDDALTNNGINQLFQDKFQGQKFVLQIVTLITLKQPLNPIIYISDGFTWIKGQLIEEAIQFSRRYKDFDTYTVVKFMSEDIIVNKEKFSFQLKKIQEVQTNVRSMIGQPIPYEDFQEKGYTNPEGRIKISDAVPTFTINKLKSTATGKIQGVLIAKVVKRPNKVNTFLNIIIQDEEGEQMQCVFFGVMAQRFHPVISEGSWYRIEDPFLQRNNKKSDMLELKITNYSKIQKIKHDSKPQQKDNIGIIHHQKPPAPAPNTSKISKVSNEGSFKDVQFKKSDYMDVTQIPNLDFYTVAKVIKLRDMKDNFGRCLTCVDKYGSEFIITLWKELQQLDIQVNQTYRFMKLKAKIYQGNIQLHSRKMFTSISIQNEKMGDQDQHQEKVPIKKCFAGPPPSKNNFKHPLKSLSSNHVVENLSKLIERTSESTQRVVYGLTLATLIMNFEYFTHSEQYIRELRRKIFYITCPKCDNGQYGKAKVDLQLNKDQLVCSNCKLPELKVMFNIKGSITDSKISISCKINNQIAQKLLKMTAAEALLQFTTKPQQLKAKIQHTMHLLKGVFKLSVKGGDKGGNRYYNICEYFTGGLKTQYKWVEEQFNKTKKAYQEWQQKSGAIITNKEYPVPSFFTRPRQAPMDLQTFANMRINHEQ